MKHNYFFQNDFKNDEKISRGLTKNSRILTKTHGFCQKTQGISLKTQLSANSELELVAEKWPKNKPGLLRPCRKVK